MVPDGEPRRVIDPDSLRGYDEPGVIGDRNFRKIAHRGDWKARP